MSESINVPTIKKWPSKTSSLKSPVICPSPQPCSTPTTLQKATATVSHNRPSKQSLVAGATPTSKRVLDCAALTTNNNVGTEQEEDTTLAVGSTCAPQAPLVDAPAERVMEHTNSENAKWPNKHGSSPQNDPPHTSDSHHTRAPPLPPPPSAAEKAQRYYQRATIDYPQKLLTPSAIDVRCTGAESTQWLAWYAQTGLPYGCPPHSLHLNDQFVTIDPDGTAPFPRWMADGLGKYFLLGMSTMLHLNQVRYSDMVDITAPPSSSSSTHGAPTRRYSMLEAVHQCMWLAVVWWQSQTFDAQLNVQLRDAIESIAADAAACEAMGLGTEYDTASLAQAMLHCIPLNVDENLFTAIQQSSSLAAMNAAASNAYLSVQQLMDMRNWSLVRVAQSTFCMNPLRDVSFWNTVPMCNVSAFKKTSAQLVILPSLSSIMRRINMLYTIFYGYSHIMRLLDQWENSIVQFMTVMGQQYDHYPATSPPPRGDFTLLDKEVSQYIYAQLRRLFEETSEERLPNDVRPLFLHEPIAFVEQCALMCFNCSARSWQTARQNIPDTSATLALACLVRASVVHWRECYNHLPSGERDKLKAPAYPQSFEFFGDTTTTATATCKNWLDISTILPQSHNPITNDATLSDSDLRPAYASADSWNASIRKRHRALRVSVIGDKFYTAPTDATHMLANITYRNYTRSIQPNRQTVPDYDHISLLISSDNRPDMLLHYAASSVHHNDVAPNSATNSPKSDRARWTLVMCNELNYPPSVTEVVVSSSLAHDSSGDGTSAAVPEKVHSTSSYLHHLANARNVVARIFETLPHTYLYRVWEVHGAVLDSRAYERAARANLMQHVMRTMNNNSGGDGNVDVSGVV